jgi:hypothetical protein
MQHSSQSVPDRGTRVIGMGASPLIVALYPHVSLEPASRIRICRDVCHRRLSLPADPTDRPISSAPCPGVLDVLWAGPGGQRPLPAIDRCSRTASAPLRAEQVNSISSLRNDPCNADRWSTTVRVSAVRQSS